MTQTKSGTLRAKFVTILSLALLFIAMGAVKAGYDLWQAKRSADEYLDQGVITFVATRMVVVKEKVQGKSGINPRNQYHSVNYLEYRAKEHSGWRYREPMGRVEGRKCIAAQKTIERRVFTIKSANRYVTVEPEETPESYAQGTRSYALLLLGLGGAYIAAFLTFHLQMWRQRRRDSNNS